MFWQENAINYHRRWAVLTQNKLTIKYGERKREKKKENEGYKGSEKKERKTQRQLKNSDTTESQTDSQSDRQKERNEKIWMGTKKTQKSKPVQTFNRTINQSIHKLYFWTWSVMWALIMERRLCISASLNVCWAWRKNDQKREHIFRPERRLCHGNFKREDVNMISQLPGWNHFWKVGIRLWFCSYFLALTHVDDVAEFRRHFLRQNAFSA